MTQTVTKKSLIGHFSALDDPRQAWKVEYRLPEIMLLVLCATLAGAETIVETALWGRKKLDFLRGLLPFKRGVPSHDALNDVINALDAELLCACFSAWVEGLRESEPDIVAIDGKTSRRAHARQGHALHTVSAWAAGQRLVLGQQATEQESNEITAIPLLLERLQLSGALVTIGAKCQYQSFRIGLFGAARSMRFWFSHCVPNVPKNESGLSKNLPGFGFSRKILTASV